MNTPLARLTLGIALAAVATLASAARLSPAERLAKATEGRTASEPVKCLRLRDIRSTQVIEGTAIVYTTLNGTVYVNTPPRGANFLRRDDVLVTDTHSSDLCNIDLVKFIDPTTHAFMGSVGLGDFVPYKKTRVDK